MVDRYREYDDRPRVVDDDAGSRPVVRDRDDAYERDVRVRDVPAREVHERPAYRREVAEREYTDAPPAATGVVATDDLNWRYSVGATFLGWCVASFLTFVLLALVAGAATGFASDGAQDGVNANDVEEFSLGITIASLVAIFVAYLVGGYAAGRIGLWRGAAHGAGVPVWTILVTVILVIVGAAIGAEALENVGLTVTGVDFNQAATTAAVVTLVLTLLAMFGGAILGGKLGERIDEDDADAVARRRTVRYGRPL